MSADVQVHGSHDGSYAFDNGAAQSGSRMGYLTELFDENTFGILTRLGIAPGCNCLDVGAGGGSVATWMSKQVGDAGSVVATDIDIRFLDRTTDSNLEVRTHNIATDPLERDRFDFAYARLVLAHIPERQEALDRMIASLAPGGWIVIEEFDARSMTNESLGAHDAMQRVMIGKGADFAFGQTLSNRLIDVGLTSVGATGHVFQWAGGSPFASLLAANFTQLREAMIETGTITAEEIDADLALLRDSRTLRPSPIMWSVWGRKPGGPARR